MADTPFGSTAGSQIDLDERVGHLLLVVPLVFHEDMATTSGVTNAIDADVVDIDTNEDLPSARFFGKALVPALHRLMVAGKPGLGRIVKGVAKAGQSAPWLFVDATDPADQQRGIAVYMAKQAGTFAPTVPAAAPAAAAPIGGQAWAPPPAAAPATAVAAAVPVAAAPAVDPQVAALQAQLAALQAAAPPAA